MQTYRNAKLVHVFDKLGLIEYFGTGIPRTLLAYEIEKVKPFFEATDNFLSMVLPNLNGLKSDEINDKINELDLEILKVINSNLGIKVPDIFENINKDSNIATKDALHLRIFRL